MSIFHQEGKLFIHKYTSNPLGYILKHGSSIQANEYVGSMEEVVSKYENNSNI